MGSVNKIIFLVIACALFWAVPGQAAEEVNGKMFYTTANIWYERPDLIESTNYHKGTILPIGTKVKITEVSEGMKPGNGSVGADMWDVSIRFTDENGNPYRLIFQSRHASAGASVWDLFRQYFSQNDPMAQGGAFTSLTAEEQKMVKAGEVAPGMSKKAVIMAYGYPPGHRTSSLGQNKWIYWNTRSKTRKISFSEDKVTDDSEAVKPASAIEACIKACKENTSRTSEQCFDDCKPQ